MFPNSCFKHKENHTLEPQSLPEMSQSFEVDNTGADYVGSSSDNTMQGEFNNKSERGGGCGEGKENRGREKGTLAEEGYCQNSQRVMSLPLIVVTSYVVSSNYSMFERGIIQEQF